MSDESKQDNMTRGRIAQKLAEHLLEFQLGCKALTSLEADLQRIGIHPNLPSNPPIEQLEATLLMVLENWGYLVPLERAAEIADEDLGEWAAECIQSAASGAGD